MTVVFTDLNTCFIFFRVVSILLYVMMSFTIETADLQFFFTHVHDDQSSCVLLHTEYIMPSIERYLPPLDVDNHSTVLPITTNNKLINIIGTINLSYF